VKPTYNFYSLTVETISENICYRKIQFPKLESKDAKLGRYCQAKIVNAMENNGKVSFLMTVTAPRRDW